MSIGEVLRKKLCNIKPNQHSLEKLAAQFDTASLSRLEPYHDTLESIQSNGFTIADFVKFEIAYCTLLQVGAEPNELELFSRALLIPSLFLHRRF